LKFRPFGRTGFDVSEIGFGAWGIGGSWWGSKPDDKAALAALRRAAELGVNFFDTAIVYGDGHSEKLVGQALRETRADAVVATKVPPKGYRWPAAPDSLARDVMPPDWITGSVEKSLRNLKLERIDLIQFHVWADGWLKEEEWWGTIERLRREGKVRWWGVSVNDNRPESALKLAESGRADSLQVIYNIFEQAPADELFPLCQKSRTALIARVPFDEGSLTGTFTKDTVFEEGDFRGNYFRGERLQEAVRRAEKLKFLLSEGSKTLAEGALRFCLSHPAVSTVIPGMRRPSRVEENAAVSDGRLLSPAVLARLKEHAWPRNFYDN
jgi:aryl-alcohol dehydrogenase-like predicted oxidoreductase